MIEQQIFKVKGGKEIIIRTAKVSDAEEFLILGKSIMDEEVFSLTQSDEINLTLEQEGQWLQSNIENENHLVLVAETGGRIVGQLDFSNGHRKRIAHTGEFGMGVHKAWRGLGIGSMLLQVMLDWAGKHPLLEKVNIRVHSTNKRAILMYEKHGFKKEGLLLKNLKYDKNNYVDVVLMGIETK